MSALDHGVHLEATSAPERSGDERARAGLVLLRRVRDDLRTAKATDRRSVIAGLVESNDAVTDVAAAFVAEPAEAKTLRAEIVTLGTKAASDEAWQAIDAARARLDEEQDRAFGVGRHAPLCRPEGRPHAVTPDGRPFLARVPGASVWFVATTGGYVPADERLLRAELTRHWPQLSVTTRTDDGRIRAMTPSELFAEYGARVDALHYSYTGATRFEYGDDLGGTLVVRVIPSSTPPAVEHADVLAWLEALVGPALPTVLDWLATLPILDKPTAALLLHGPRSLGKSMLSHGAAAYFGAATADYDDIMKGRFNGALLRSPVVALEEGTQVDARSAAFRRLIANTVHAIEEKNRPTATLHGCPRLVITTNNADPLGLGREDLTRDDEDAIGERIIPIDCHPAAGELLAARGGRTWTAEWVRRSDGTPGKVPETIAWLHRERRVTPGPRFLVHGDAARWAAQIGTRTGLPAVILDAVIEALERDRARRLRGDAVPRDGAVAFTDPAHPGAVLVSQGNLAREWGGLTGDARAPQSTALARALGRLTGSAAGDRKVRLSDGSRVRAVPIPVHLFGDRVTP